MERVEALVAERKGMGECCEAQADGVPCGDASSDCPRCGRARKKPVPEDLGGIMMPDGLYPTGV
jgi:hypothetical protein